MNNKTRQNFESVKRRFWTLSSTIFERRRSSVLASFGRPRTRERERERERQRQRQRQRLTETDRDRQRQTEKAHNTLPVLRTGEGEFVSHPHLVGQELTEAWKEFFGRGDATLSPEDVQAMVQGIEPYHADVPPLTLGT